MNIKWNEALILCFLLTRMTSALPKTFRDALYPVYGGDDGYVIRCCFVDIFCSDMCLEAPLSRRQIPSYQKRNSGKRTSAFHAIKQHRIRHGRQRARTLSKHTLGRETDIDYTSRWQKRRTSYS